MMWLSKRVRYLSVLLVFYTTPGFAQSPSPSWKASMTKGNEQFHSRKYTEAEEAFREALLECSRTGMTIEYESTSLSWLSLSLTRQGKVREAEWYASQSIKITAALFQPDDYPTLMAVKCMADVYRAQSRFEEAALLYNESVRVSEKVFGKNSLETAGRLSDLATASFSKGDYKQGETHARRALWICESGVPQDHEMILQALTDLSFILSARKQFDEARTLTHKALTLAERGARHEDPILGRLRLLLAYINYMTGRYKDSITEIDRAVTLFKRAGEKFDSESSNAIDLRKAMTERKPLDDAFCIRWYTGPGVLGGALP